VKKINLIVFSENVLGGIQTFYLNLLSNLNKDVFNINWILINHKSEKRAKAPEFSLSNKKANYDGNCSNWRRALQISKNIPKGKGLIVANREFELESLYLYPQKNKNIIHIVHDDYYLQFALKYEKIVSAFVAHNTFVFDELVRILPSNRKLDIYFLPYGIRLSPWQRKENLASTLTVAFIARLDQAKGIHELCKIDDIFLQKSIKINWLVIGDGPEKNNFLETIKSRKNFEYYLAKDDLDIFSRIKNCDIYILPSTRDGTPVSLLESMSCGLVPLVYEFNPGIRKIITYDIGYVIETGNFVSLANSIEVLDKNRIELENKSNLCLAKVQSSFNIQDRVKDYEELFLRVYNLPNRVYDAPPHDSIFDSPFVPNSLYHLILKLKNKMNIIISSYKNSEL
jgi:glycosyltransferase involved in cell wall biosynthesis